MTAMFRPAPNSYGPGASGLPPDQVRDLLTGLR